MLLQELMFVACFPGRYVAQGSGVLPFPSLPFPSLPFLFLSFPFLFLLSFFFLFLFFFSSNFPFFSCVFHLPLSFLYRFIILLFDVFCVATDYRIDGDVCASIPGEGFCDDPRCGCPEEARPERRASIARGSSFRLLIFLLMIDSCFGVDFLVFLYFVMGCLLPRSVCRSKEVKYLVLHIISWHISGGLARHDNFVTIPCYSHVVAHLNRDFSGCRRPLSSDTSRQFLLGRRRKERWLAEVRRGDGVYTAGGYPTQIPRFVSRSPCFVDLAQLALMQSLPRVFL